ncbi:MAG: hypothetical protein LUF91_02625 [Oscillospiraceae bacterium]|nr:hypothetical protein [Oscillospiraceae bacterium]
MKLLQKKNYTGTIRQVRNDEKTKCIAVVGTVADLLKEGILDFCDCDGDLWLAISNERKVDNHFGKTRDEALELFAAAGY